MNAPQVDFVFRPCETGNVAPVSLFFIFGTSFVVGLSGAVTPGPLLALNITEAARRGFWAGPLLVLGHAIIELVLVIALAWGLSQILGSSLVAGIIGVVGGLFLMWMSYSLFRQARHQTLPVGANPQGGYSTRRLVLAGVVVSVANPFWLLWWATVGTTYLLWSLTVGIVGVALFYVGHILSDLGWYSLVSLLIAKGRRLMSNRVYRGLLGICGIALLGLGSYFLVSGAMFLASG